MFMHAVDAYMRAVAEKSKLLKIFS